MSNAPAQRPPPRWAYWLSGQPLFNGLGKGYRALRSSLEKIPAFAALDRLAKGVTGVAFSVLRLPAPLESRLDPFLDIQVGRKMDRVVVVALFGFFGALGFYPSSLGHMDTTPYLFTVLPFVGVFNPYLGVCSAVVFAVCDWGGKWIYPFLSVLGNWFPAESVYGANWSDGAQNFFGARIGYLFAYSTALFTALLPGILARISRQIAYRVARSILGSPAAAAAVGLLLLGGGALAVAHWAEPSGVALLAVFPVVIFAASSAAGNFAAGATEAIAQGVATLGQMAGAAFGGLFSNVYARGPGNYLAFEAVRADPDLSCRALSAGNYMGHLPGTMVAAGAGGLFPPGSGGALIPGSSGGTTMGSPIFGPGAIGGSTAPPAKPAGTAPKLGTEPFRGTVSESLRPDPVAPPPPPGTPGAPPPRTPPAPPPGPRPPIPPPPPPGGTQPLSGTSVGEEPTVWDPYAPGDPGDGGDTGDASEPTVWDPWAPADPGATADPGDAAGGEPPDWDPYAPGDPGDGGDTGDATEPPDWDPWAPEDPGDTADPGDAAGGQAQPAAGGQVQPGAGGQAQPGAGGQAQPAAGGQAQPAAGGQAQPPPAGAAPPPNKIVLSGREAEKWLRANNLWSGNEPSPNFLNSSKLHGGGYDPKDGRIAIVVDDDTPGVPDPPPTAVPSGQDPGPSYRQPQGQTAGGQAPPPPQPTGTATQPAAQPTPSGGSGTPDAAEMALSYAETLLQSAGETLLQSAVDTAGRPAVEAFAKKGLDALKNLDAAKKSWTENPGTYQADWARDGVCEKTGLSKEQAEALLNMPQEDFEKGLKILKGSLGKLAGGGGQGGAP